jgi:hypothetical protein
LCGGVSNIIQRYKKATGRNLAALLTSETTRKNLVAGPRIKKSNY